jgi:hypothetical protein
MSVTKEIKANTSVSGKLSRIYFDVTAHRNSLHLSHCRARATRLASRSANCPTRCECARLKVSSTST